MRSIGNTVKDLAKLILFWVLIFDFGRILFSIHNWSKLSDVSMGEWLLSFLFSLRVDLATASALSAIPLLIITLRFLFSFHFFQGLLRIVLMFELAIVACIYSGEINAYTEWNHKLTTQVFMHLSNPSEVFKTADYSMTIWFFIYVILFILVGNLLYKKFFRPLVDVYQAGAGKRFGIALSIFFVFGSSFFLMLRGGIQEIPLTIDSAYYSNSHIANDISVNSVYFFSKSFLLYNHSDLDKNLLPIEDKEAEILVTKLYDYPKKHANYIFKNKQPNIVFVVLEGWSADVVDCMSDAKGNTPHIDQLAEEGLLFTNIYACGGTSEVGNSSIFSGYPALPETSITMQPEKHRKINSINQDLEQMGYATNYLFSGDLSYGNIGGYLIDHGFNKVEDEDVFSSNLGRGKLNFYDEDLFDLLGLRIKQTKEPFLYCAFTGSTHSPYDHPKAKNQNFRGAEEDYVNSIIYSDGCIGDFISKSKKEKWFSNTIFIFVADHGHATPSNPNPSTKQFFRIPFLIWGDPLNDEYKGVKIEKIGSQADVVATLLYQLNGDLSRYPWSKDLLNPKAPEFALHTINRGFGWISNKGNFIYHMDTKTEFENTFAPTESESEINNCRAFMNRFYANYKSL